MVRIFPAFFSHYPSIFSLNVGKCGKNADQNNSEYGHFLRSVIFHVNLPHSQCLPISGLYLLETSGFLTFFKVNRNKTMP